MRCALQLAHGCLEASSWAGVMLLSTMGHRGQLGYLLHGESMHAGSAGAA
eukprot:CAMPEP_0181259216 /NCGR_PEP_ID=MMETSP1097-20121128/295_1 /TAXON_ID=35684 /ORGANISM="Pseudopedinella elastica, Strain CCMP716" /LENGTH=49 /DNA_ID= /DNA_START= /DNA_END= /DNA_ORIENTATION=